MTFNATDWTTVISVAAGASVTIAALWKKIEKSDPGLIKQLPHEVVKVADGFAHVVEDLAKTPWFAGEAAKGKIEAKHITDKLLSSALAQEIAKALAAAGKDWNSMSQIEQGTLLTAVQAALSKIGVTVTSAQIVAAIKPVEDAIALLKPAMEKAANDTAAIVGPAPEPAKQA